MNPAVPVMNTTARPRRLAPGAIIASLRLFALPISLLSVPMVTAAVLPPPRWRWDILILSTAGVACLHLVGNLLNDYFDHKFSVDRHNPEDDGTRPGRVLVRGDLRPADVLIEALVCSAAAGLIALYLVWECGASLVWFGLIGIAGLYAYTGPPFKLKNNALGELTMFVVFGPALGLGAAFAQTGRLELMALWVSLVPGLATAATLAGNNFRDRDEDARAGIRTIAQFRHGTAARVVYVVLAIGAALVPFVLAALRLAPPALLGAPLLLLLLARPFRNMASGKRQPDIDVETVRFEAALLVAMLIAFVFQPQNR
jgi:1,4-dihydroxy-2-naphthoate polyprenyltransferase